MDLLDFFRGVLPWSKLRRLLERLPAHGHYKSALSSDESLTPMWERIALTTEDDPPPTMLGWSPEYTMLVALVEAVRNLIAVTVAVNSKDGRVDNPPSMPRPVTALQKARNKARDDARKTRVAALVTPLPAPDPQPDPPPSL